MNRKTGLTAVIILGIIALGVLYSVVDPAESKWMPKCVFKMVTGYDCPGCGSQRMLHSLLHGDLAGAWQANAFLVLLLPVLGIMLFAELFRSKYPMLFKTFFSTASCVLISVGIVLWFILRNFC